MSVAQRLFDQAFETRVLEQVDEFPNTHWWSAAGKGKRKNLLDGEDGTWWRANGPAMVQAWIDWREKAKWQVWTTPDGQPAIELRLDWEAKDGCPERAIVDRIMIDPTTKNLIILDIKSGARSPESDLQLGYYRYGLFHTYGIDVRFGAYWMARTGEVPEIFDLSRFEPGLIEKWMEKFRWARENGIFLPNVTFRCRACPMRDYCLAYGGSRSEADPDHPNHNGGNSG